MNSEALKIKKNNEQGGAALVISIFAILLLTVIGFAIISAGLTSQEIARNSRNQSEAFYISEAGLTHATQIILKTSSSEFTAVLQAGDGVANTGDELSTRPSNLTPIPLAGLTLGNGYYVVKISDDPAETDGNPNADSNGRLVITSTGYGQNGATVTSEAIIGMPNSDIPAMIVNGNAQISGTNVFRGTNGSVHVNGNLAIGDPLMILTEQACADGFFSASGNITTPHFARTGAGCNVAGVTKANQNNISAPTWNIRASFYNRADYVMGAIGSQAGKVYNSSGTMIADTSLTSGIWTMPAGGQWSWNAGNGTWTSLSMNYPSGTYYSEGNLILDSNIGTISSPITATFIAEEHIEVKKTSFVKPYLESFGFMAGYDLQFSTKVTSAPSFPSIFYSGHQVNISGHSDLVGVIIVANLADTNSPVCGCNYVARSGSGAVKINANFTIIYNGGLFGGGGAPKLISWREVKY